MSSPFSLPDTFELSDIISLQQNELNPRVCVVHGKKSISLTLGPTMIYELDNTGNEVLVVINVGDEHPLIILAKQIPDLPPASLSEWKQSFGFVFENPNEENLQKLFGAKFICNPAGRKYNRTLPKVVADENADSAHLSAGTGRGLIKSHGSDQIVGSITVYESEDPELAEKFLLTVNFCSAQAQATGGLMTLYVGHQINPSEIK